MSDSSGKVRGIRLRTPDGFKYAVAGSGDGLFIPIRGTDGTQGTELAGGCLLICEGPTDTAALLDIGFPHVVGRACCLGGVALLTDLCRAWQPGEVAIAADGDEPGQRGAERLAGVLTGYVPEVRIFRPPDGIKDVRQWVNKGGTKQDVQQAIQSAPVRRLAVRLAGADAENGGSQ